MARAWIFIAVSVLLCAAAGSAWASFPGRNGKIAYAWLGESAFRAGPTETSIRTVDPRSGVVRVLKDCPLRTDAPSGYTDCSVSAPSWTPDGSILEFPIIRITPDFTGQPWRFEPGLAAVAPDGSDLGGPTTEDRYFALAWAPSGEVLLVERELEQSATAHAIFSATSDGVAQSQISPAFSQAPDWSSRGQIAFGRYRGAQCLPGCEDVFVTRLGGPLRRLTHRGGSDPSWSPDGTKLAFVRRSRGETNVYIVRRNGRGLRRLTRRGGAAPVWSPNGKWIAFIRNGDLHVIRTNGRDRRRLVEGQVAPGLGEGPRVLSLDWQALPRR